MKNLFILILVLFVLAGCQTTNKLSTLKNSPLTAIFSDSGSISHISIPVTGSMEIYSDSVFFQSFKNNPRCRDGGLLEDSIYCEGISGYNHIYKIPGLKLEYLYKSEKLAHYIGSGIENFLFATGGINFTEGRIITLAKDPKDSPLSIIKSHLGKGGCEITTGGFGTGYDSYGVWMFRDFNLDDYKNISNRCIPDLPIDRGNDSWLYVFSPQHTNYYYIIGTNMTAGGIPDIYTNQSLKLFVE